MHNLVGEKLKELLKLHGKSLQDLSRQTDVHAARWSQVINGTKRLSIDLAIRLGKVFPREKLLIEEMAFLLTNMEDMHIGEDQRGAFLWLHLDFINNCISSVLQDGPMYRNIKPFGGNE